MDMKRYQTAIDRNYNKGLNHGLLDIYEPGLMIYGETRKAYMQGYKQGIMMRNKQELKRK